MNTDREIFELELQKESLEFEESVAQKTLFAIKSNKFYNSTEDKAYFERKQQQKKIAFEAMQQQKLNL